MTSWILLLALAAVFTLVVRRHPANGPELPHGYDRERQLDELRAMSASATRGLLP